MPDTIGPSVGSVRNVGNMQFRWDGIRWIPTHFEGGGIGLWVNVNAPDDPVAYPLWFNPGTGGTGPAPTWDSGAAWDTQGLSWDTHGGGGVLSVWDGSAWQPVGGTQGPPGPPGTPGEGGMSLEEALATFLPLSGGGMSGQIDMGGFPVNNLATVPNPPNGAAPRYWVQQQIAATSLYQGVWNAQHNVPDLSQASLHQNDFGWIAITPDPDTPFVVPNTPSMPGLNGQTVNYGDHIIWSSVEGRFDVIASSNLSLTEAEDLFLLLSGGTMEGPLLVDRAPTDPMQVANRAWVLSQIGTGNGTGNGGIPDVTGPGAYLRVVGDWVPGLPLSGGTMAGPINMQGLAITNLPADPPPTSNNATPAYWVMQEISATTLYQGVWQAGLNIPDLSRVETHHNGFSWIAVTPDPTQPLYTTATGIAGIPTGTEIWYGDHIVWSGSFNRFDVIRSSNLSLLEAEEFFVLKAGDEMEGPLYLTSPPPNPPGSLAARVDWVRNEILNASFGNGTGPSIEFPIQIPQGGTGAIDAVTARANLGITQANLGGPFLALAGGTMGGYLTLVGPPRLGQTNINDAANRGYIDAIIAEMRVFRDIWRVAPNVPNIITFVTDPGISAGDYFIASTADPNVPEAAPPGMPGAASPNTIKTGDQIHNGDLVIWSEFEGGYELLRGSPLTLLEAEELFLSKYGDEMNGSLTIGGNLYVVGQVNLTHPLPIAQGGTGARDAAQARLNLGITEGGAPVQGVSSITVDAPLTTTANPITSSATIGLALTSSHITTALGFTPLQGPLTSAMVTGALGYTPLQGPLTSTMVTTALGFTPISSVTSAMVTGALGFTPLEGPLTSAMVTGALGFTPLASPLTSAMVTGALGFTPLQGPLTSAMVTGALGFTPISTVTSTMVTDALGFTPLQGPLTSTMVTTALGFTPIGTVTSAMVTGALGFTPIPDADTTGGPFARQGGGWVPITTGPSGNFLPITGGTLQSPGWLVVPGAISANGGLNVTANYGANPWMLGVAGLASVGQLVSGGDINSGGSIWAENHLTAQGGNLWIAGTSFLQGAVDARDGLSVRGAFDPLYVGAPIGSYARTRYDIMGQRIWTCGIGPDSNFMIADENAGSVRLWINTDGWVHVAGLRSEGDMQVAAYLRAGNVGVLDGTAWMRQGDGFIQGGHLRVSQNIAADGWISAGLNVDGRDVNAAVNVWGGNGLGVGPRDAAAWLQRDGDGWLLSHQSFRSWGFIDSGADIRAAWGVYAGGVGFWNDGGWFQTPNSIRTPGAVQANDIIGIHFYAPGNNRIISLFGLECVNWTQGQTDVLACRGGVHIDGALWLGGQLLTPPSDIALKRDIEICPSGALDWVNRLPVKQFHWREDPDDAPLHRGFIVQDVQEVTGDAGCWAQVPGKPLSLSFWEMFTVLWQAVYELSEGVRELKGRT